MDKEKIIIIERKSIFTKNIKSTLIYLALYTVIALIIVGIIPFIKTRYSGYYSLINFISFILNSLLSDEKAHLIASIIMYSGIFLSIVSFILLLYNKRTNFIMKIMCIISSILLGLFMIILPIFTNNDGVSQIPTVGCYIMLICFILLIIYQNKFKNIVEEYTDALNKEERDNIHNSIIHDEKITSDKIFCTECGKEGLTQNDYCIYCGSKLKK